MAAFRAGKKLTGFAALALAVSAGVFLRPTAGQDYGLPDEVNIAISLPAFAVESEAPESADADRARVRAVFPPPAPEQGPRLKEMEGQLKALHQELAALRDQVTAQNPFAYQAVDPNFACECLWRFHPQPGPEKAPEKKDRPRFFPGGIEFDY
jgi:hypothetical protein